MAGLQAPWLREGTLAATENLKSLCVRLLAQDRPGCSPGSVPTFPVV